MYNKCAIGNIFSRPHDIEWRNSNIVILTCFLSENCQYLYYRTSFSCYILFPLYSRLHDNFFNSFSDLYSYTCCLRYVYDHTRGVLFLILNIIRKFVKFNVRLYDKDFCHSKTRNSSIMRYIYVYMYIRVQRGIFFSTLQQVQWKGTKITKIESGIDRRNVHICIYVYIDYTLVNFLCSLYISIIYVVRCEKNDSMW
jgi:hypothetical protein